MRLIFDLESNGLLDELNRIHCICLKNIDTEETYSFAPSEVETGVKMLMEADLVVGHNVIGFDIPALKKVYPWFRIRKSRVRDTLIMSLLLYPDLSDRDWRLVAQDETFPRNCVGKHRLEAWGHRLKCYKGDYDGGWSEWSSEMQYYCEQDVEVTDRLWKLIESKGTSPVATELEHQVKWVIAEQERCGFPFNEEAALSLKLTLDKRRAELEAELQDAFPPWEEELGLFTPKVNNKARGYVKGVSFMKTKTVVFNAGSRMHIESRLKAIHGWKPKEFTEDGRAKVDEKVLSSLSYPEAKLLSEYLMIQKRIGQISDGASGWCKKVKNGRIHGQVITNGAVTGRATHRSPNTAQTPSVYAPYGKECRSCWTASKGRVLIGADVSGLELRMLANKMWHYDKGAYAKEVVDGDVHTTNQTAAGLPTRNDAKTFIYAFLYGAGDAKIGSIIGKGASAGKQIKKAFFEKVPALKQLVQSVKKEAEKNGYLIGLDGRQLHIRAVFASLNTSLQSDGSLVCKQWLVEVDKELRSRGWQDKCQQVAWIHDELQFDCDPDIAEECGKLIVDCIARAGDHFNVKVPLTGEYNIGANWAETH